MLTMAQLFLLFLAVYLSLGLAFALLFALNGYKKIDKLAATAPLRIRILWMPAAIALWPLLTMIWSRSGANTTSQEGLGQ